MDARERAYGGARWRSKCAASSCINHERAALARKHDEFRVAAGFPTEALVRDHQRRARNQEFADAVDRLLRNLDAVERLRRGRRRLQPYSWLGHFLGFLPRVPL